MKELKFIAAITAFVFLQATVLNIFRVFGVGPDLGLICVIVACVYFDWAQAVFFTLCAGFLKDIFCLDALGINTLLFAILGFAIYKLSRKVSIDDQYALIAVVSAVVLLKALVLRFIFFYLGEPLTWGIFLRIAFLESIYTALVFPLVFKFLSLMECLPAGEVGSPAGEGQDYPSHFD